MLQEIVHFGWISVLLATVAGIVTMRIWPMAARQSFSENVARHRSSTLAFAIWMTIVTILFYWFLIGWLGPQRGMNNPYYIVAWSMLIFQLTLAWLPATKGLSLLIHNIASYGVVLLMPVLLALLASSSMVELSGLQLIVLVGFMAYMVVVMVMFFFVRRARTYFLWFQMGMTMAAWIAILTLAYAG